MKALKGKPNSKDLDVIRCSSSPYPVKKLWCRGTYLLISALSAFLFDKKKHRFFAISHQVLKDTHLFIAIIIDCIWNLGLLVSTP